jgi:hypothetical protein
MRRTLGAALVAGALVLVPALAACGGSGDDEGGPTTTTGSTTTGSTTTTEAPRTPSETSVPRRPAGPTAGQGSARAAIDLLVAAWIAHDQITAGTVATEEAVQALFAQPPDGYVLYGCDTGEFDTSTCNFRNRATAGYASLTAEKAPIGWIVTSAFLTTDG